MLGEIVISTTWTIYITVQHSWKMDTYCEHPRHCELRRYGVGLCGMVGKDVVRIRGGVARYGGEGSISH